jgi:hypothetical protein
MNAHNRRITIDLSICHGKPANSGLRYPVETRLLVLAVITIFLHKIPTNIPITIRHIIPYV